MRRSAPSSSGTAVSAPGSCWPGSREFRAKSSWLSSQFTGSAVATLRLAVASGVLRPSGVLEGAVNGGAGRLALPDRLLAGAPSHYPEPGRQRCCALLVSSKSELYSPKTGSDQIRAMETTDGSDELPRRAVLRTCDLTLLPRIRVFAGHRPVGALPRRSGPGHVAVPQAAPSLVVRPPDLQRWPDYTYLVATRSKPAQSEIHWQKGRSTVTGHRAPRTRGGDPASAVPSH